MVERVFEQKVLMTLLVYPRRLRGVALRDQVIEVLRAAAPMPLSTTQIGARLGTYDLLEVMCGHRDCTDPNHMRVLWRNGQYRSWDFASSLRSLERKGIVERHIPPRSSTAHGAHYWRFIGPQEVQVGEA